MDWEEKSSSEGNEDVEEQPPAELVYANVVEFVTEMLAPTYRRQLDPAGRSNTFTWCAQWWRHDEAVSRLTGLWRAWENLRLDPTTGLAVWWQNYADPTMRVLFEENGPFHGCTPREHRPKGVPLTLEPPPEGLFD